MREDILQKLNTTRQASLAFLETIQEEQWQTAVYAEDSEWRVIDLWRHVVDAERSMTGLMSRIRDGGEGVPADFDLSRWNASRVRKSKHKTPADLKAEMTQNHEALLAFINTLTEADWPKKGRHGSMRIMSIEEICHLIADHEQNHMQDIRQALANP